jgi:hypothetical protein
MKTAKMRTPDLNGQDELDRLANDLYSRLFRTGAHLKSPVPMDPAAEILRSLQDAFIIGSLTRSALSTPDLVRLPGARMVRSSEPEQAQKIKEAEIKRLTGGEATLVRRMQKEFIEVDPKFKLTISSGHKPDVRGKDDRIWRRRLHGAL